MRVLVLLLSLVLLLPSPALEAKKRRARKSKPKPLATQEASLREPPDEESALWNFWKAVLKAEKKLGNKDWKDAVKILEELPPPPKELVNRNETYYRTLYKKALETGIEAAQRLKRSHETASRSLWAYFPDFEDPPSTIVPEYIRAEDKIARAHILYEKSLFETIPNILSAEDLEKKGLSNEEACHALFELGSALNKLRRRDEALETLGRMETMPCHGRILARGLYWKGLIEAIAKNDEAAETTYRRLAEISDDRYSDDAYYRLIRIYGGRNDAAKAAKARKDLLALPHGDMKEKLLWEDAFAAYQAKKVATALGLLEKILATKDIGTEALPQALYWKARITEVQSGRKKKRASASLYRELVKRYPFSFYSLLAETRLGKRESRPAIARDKPPPPSDPVFAAGLEEVDKLNRKKRHDAAADVLDYLTHMDPDASRESPAAIAERWSDSGDYNRALEIAAETLDQAASDINLPPDSPFTRSLYPLAYPEVTKREARKNNLPLELILGMMREESLFQPAVLSHAGAVGLMQLMPATARIKAKKLGIDHSYADLKTPEHNVHLGSSYLRELMNRFENRTPLAVMAYNAGPANVSRWLRAQGDLPLDEFIETIPFTETRDYVKRVLRSASIYGHLLGRSNGHRLFSNLDPPR